MTALVYWQLYSSLYTGAVQGYWNTPDWSYCLQGCRQVSTSLTRRCCQNQKVSLRVFIKAAQYDPQMCSNKDYAKFVPAYLVTGLSYALHFGWKQGVIENFNIWAISKKISKMFDILCLVSINDWMMQKKYKTDYKKFMHVYKYL
jgi:hypothetical protein